MAAAVDAQRSKASNQHQEDQRLIEVRYQPDDHLGAETEPPNDIDQAADPGELSVHHAEHLGLLGEAICLGDAPGVLDLRLRSGAAQPGPVRS